MAKRPPREISSSAEKTPFLSLTLSDCYRLALKRSETVAIQKEDIQEAEAQFFKATGEALGDVDFVMTRLEQEKLEGSGGGSVGSTFAAPERRERKFVITQPLFQGFKSLGALTGAGSLRKQQKEEWVRAKQLLFLDTAQAFYQLLRQKKDVEIIERIHTLFKERLAELSEREKIGRSRPGELATATARMKVIEAEQAEAQGAFLIAL